MTRKQKWAIGCGGLLLVVIALAVVGVLMGSGNTASVRVQPVERRDLVETVTASGWVRPYRSVDVQSDVMGRVVQLAVREGDQVTRGQLLLRLDATQYEAAVSRARGAVSEALAREAQARAGMLRARQALDRARALHERDRSLISDEALEQAETEEQVQEALLEAARFGVDQARAALREAENQRSKTVIRAPIDGMVTRLSVEEGETAIVGTMNNPGSLLLTVSDLSTMEAVVQVDETDVTRIQLEDSAIVEIDAFPRQRFHGTVSEIGHSAVRPPASAQATGTATEIDFQVVIRLSSPPPTLRPDLSATAEVITATREGALAIPIVALTVRERDDSQDPPTESPEARAAAAALDSGSEDQEGVFMVREGKAHFRPVDIGIAGSEYFEVVVGLEEGDTVVSGPYEVVRELEDGQEVRVIGAEAQSGGAGR
ncbi:MAG TPA: efflux RND transporter periplasmic adaptor subunit [Longimicrobiales bacterium]|nr:efflux RND transporter periplasmic adaptor subunit [Longimicrobiales bacterium]